jgi:uncharacterized protein YxjI
MISYCVPTGVTKVYPNVNVKVDKPVNSSSDAVTSILTVWNKSLLFNCKGFTVFDCKGNLVFRVDNYMQGNKGQILLMDGAGNPLLTIRRKIRYLSSWLVYEGEYSTVVNNRPLYLVKKHVQVNILNNSKSSSLAQVISYKNNKVQYEIEGCYTQRRCAVYDVVERRKLVAEIKRKEGVGMDVFRLIVQADQMEEKMAMTLVILLQQMFSSS